MKYLKFSPIILAIAFLLYYYFFISEPQRETSPPQNEPSSQSINTEQKQWETKSDDQPPVSIKVTPTLLGQEAKQWKFTVIFDTHAGSLDDDLLKVASLADNKGNSYQPVAWEGPGPGGHHREGALIFNPILPLPEYVELKIKDVDGIKERLFKWEMK
jgi:hypothetical protein